MDVTCRPWKIRQTISFNQFSGLTMNGFALLSASSLIYFTHQIFDGGFCEAAHWASLQRDPNRQLSYARFIEHFHRVLDVPKIEGVAFQAGRQCLLRCLNNDRCFSTNIGAFRLPNGNISCDLLPTDKYNASEKFKVNNSFYHYSIKVSITFIFHDYVLLVFSVLL